MISPLMTPPVQADHGRDSLEACLLFLCAHFELPASASVVRAELVGEERKLDVDDFLSAAGRVGLSAEVVQTSLDRLHPSALPLVALLKDGRAAVILDVPDPSGILVYDPVRGEEPARLDFAEFERAYAGDAVLVEPERGPLPAIEKNSHGWFWRPLARRWWTYVQVLVAATVSNVLALAISIFSMVVYDRVLPSGAVESLFALTLGVSIAIAFDFIIKTLRTVFIDSAGQRADLEMGRLIYDHILNMKLSAKRGSTGAFTSILREFESLREFFTSASLVAIVDLPFLFFFIFVIWRIGHSLALVPILVVPVVLLAGAAVQPMLARLSEQTLRLGQSKQSVLVETMHGLETIKAIGAGPLMRRRWEESIVAHGRLGVRSRLLMHLALNVTAFGQQAAQVAIVVYGALLTLDGSITQGAMIACAILGGRTLAPLNNLANVFVRLNNARAAFNSLNALMATPAERDGERRYLSRPRLQGGISLRNVTFRYPDQPADVIKDVSFTIRPGEKVAILGKIGSGKSTLARLILGLYEPGSGAVLADDADIRQIDPIDLRRNIGSVLQDTWLFSGSIRQNIAIGAVRPNDESILKAAEAAGVFEFVSKTQAGFDQILGERGEGLSGGQRQSVAIARALIGDPAVLLMDEPTSMMDQGTEAGVLAGLKTFVRDRTLIVITHRMSLLDLVDRVIIIDDGRVAADGPKAALLRPVPAPAAANS